MSQDEELKNILRNYVKRLISVRAEHNAYAIEQLAIHEIQDLYRTREATLIREARINELNRLTGCPPIMVETSIRERLMELTNQQEGEQ